jgi:hypothetical protein
MIDINNLTLKQIKEIQELTTNSVNESGSLMKIGKHYFIRTVTMYLVGKLKHVTNRELLLEDASWIPDTGRFSDALSTGIFNEVEPFCDDVIVNRDCIVDATLFNHLLPNEKK